MLKTFSKKTNFILIGIIVGFFVGVSIKQIQGETVVPGTLQADNLLVNGSGSFGNGLVVSNGNMLVPNGKVGIGILSSTEVLTVTGKVLSSGGFCIGTTCVSQWSDLGQFLGIGTTVTPPPVTPISYNLTVTKAGAGAGAIVAPLNNISCGRGSTACFTTATSGTSIVLTADPDIQGTFAGWSGDCSGTASTCTVVMSSDKNVTATFTPANQNNYIYIYRVGNGKITVDPANKSCDFTAGCAMMAVPVLTGTSVTLNAIPAAGYVFSGWSSSVSGTCSGISAQCTFILNENNNVTATFTSDGGNGKVNPNSPVTITSPNGGVYKQGDTVHIQWTGAPAAASLPIQIHNTTSSPYVTVLVAQGTQNGYDWTIPATVAEDTYVVYMTFNGTWQESTHFTIQTSH